MSEFRPVRYRRPNRWYRPDLQRSGGLIGVAGVVCVLFVDLASAPLLPWWVTTLLVVFSAFLMLSAVAWFTPRPRRAVWLPVVGLAVWLVAMAVRIL